MPDFDLRLSASFISSKDGDTPSCARRRLMNINSSYCFLVSIGPPAAAELASKNKTKTGGDVLVWFAPAVKTLCGGNIRARSDAGETAGEGDDRDARAR